MYTFSSKQIKYSNGFTIVELLVVVVVIAILAAITTIAYNGITRSAAESSLKSDLRTTATKIGLYQAENGTYPSALSNGMAAESSANSLTYSSLGNTYCLIATTKKVGGPTFHITEKGTVTAGECISPSVVAGSSHTLAVSSAGVLRAWGENFQGALGDGTTTNRTAPVTIAGGALTGKKIKLVAAGNHSLAVDDAGVLYAWGSNYAGQLGDGTTTDRLTPVAVTGGSLAGKRVIAIDAGDDYSLALTSDGIVHAWGYNGFGQLGDNTTTQRNAPVAITGGSLGGKVVKALAVGSQGHSLVIDSNGGLHAWGNNSNGQLGNGTTTEQHLPIAVSGGSIAAKSIVYVTGGMWHTIAVASDGTVHAWGTNTSGELGDNTTTQRNTPVAVTGGSLAGKTIVRVVAGKGGNHSFAVASDGTLHAWGNNSVGKLGNGTTTNQLQPILINGGTLAGKSVVFVAAGAAFSVALASDGSVHSWGGNGIGQLGDGTTTSRFLPGSASALQL